MKHAAVLMMSLAMLGSVGCGSGPKTTDARMFGHMTNQEYLNAADLMANKFEKLNNALRDEARAHIGTHTTNFINNHKGVDGRVSVVVAEMEEFIRQRDSKTDKVNETWLVATQIAGGFKAATDNVRGLDKQLQVLDSNDAMLGAKWGALGQQALSITRTMMILGGSAGGL